MPRQARLDIPGALHHIMVRGINKSKIFADDQDKIRFLDRLRRNVIAGGCSIFAWVAMDNHIHLLFKSGEQSGISSVMRKLLTWYAQYFNRRHNRTGHLFENRYKSILCDEDNYFLALVRYIHLNPVRAGIVKTMDQLDHYCWSGHQALVGGAIYEWMDTAYVLKQFGAHTKVARDAYSRFVEQGMSIGKVPELSGCRPNQSKGGWSQVVSARKAGDGEKLDARILGGEEFIDAILREAGEKIKRQFKMRYASGTMQEIIKAECEEQHISLVELQNGCRRKEVSALRRKIAMRGLDELGVTLAEIARHVGVNTSSVAKAVALARSSTNDARDKES